LLLGPEATPDAAAPSGAPAVEEAAILYANGELDAAEQALLAILADTDHGDRLPWWMLFDLYQAAGREQDFDSIAIDYASRFETSPPAYSPLLQAGLQPPGLDAAPAFAGATPTASLSGPLDESTAAALAHVLAPSANPLVRLEFGAVTAATPAGCGVLLDALQRLRREGRELVLAGAERLVAVLRPMLAIGDRSAGQAPWLLLLELLLLANREKDFEETAMDFCVTFEVSPPSFEAPARAAVTAGASTPAASVPGADDHFLLPGVVEGDSTALLAAIEAHAARCRHLVLDCSRLARIDYGAATTLVARLGALAEAGQGVELRDLNHLAAALLRLLGLGPPTRLATHKY
jgi:anti-anti-sigma regulatory factor